MGHNVPVTEIESISNLLYDFGPAVVILSIFLMLFIIVLFVLIKQQSVSNNQMIKEHQVLIERLLNQNDSKENKLDKDVVNLYVKINNAIKLEVTTFVNLLEANRLAIYLFHNGTTALSGLPFLKFSCISEYTKYTERSRIKSHYGFPVNLMSDFVKDLVNHTEIIYVDDTQPNTYSDDALVSKLISAPADKYIIKGIFDSNFNLIAFAVVEFDSTVLTNENCSYKKERINELIKIISPILEYSDFNSIYKGGVN